MSPEAQPRLGTGVVLLLGAVGRLGPNANAAVCSSALFAWGVSFLAATRQGVKGPLEGSAFMVESLSASSSASGSLSCCFVGRSRELRTSSPSITHRRESPLPPREDFAA